MLKKSLIILFFIIYMTNPVFANHRMMDPYKTTSKQCEIIAKDCLNAGFKGKAFWFGCMKPILYNQTVKGVKVKAKVVRACRDFKIKDLEKQLDELKKVSND